MAADQDEVDFALAAYREDGAWQLQELADTALLDMETLAKGLRRLPSDGGALALISLDEDVLMIVRVTGATTRVLLSDVTAADEFGLARSALELLGIPFAEEEDDPAPAGDLDIVGDLGMQARELALLIDDTDLYSDEILSDVATRLGFGPVFDDLVGLTSA